MELHLPPSFLKALEEGQTIALNHGTAPMAIVVPAAPPTSQRPCGLATGEFSVPDGFNDPLPEVEREIYGT